MTVLGALVGIIQTQSGIWIVGLTAVILATVYVLYRRCYAPYQVLKRCGIKGPKPLPIIGNQRDIAKEGDLTAFLTSLHKNFGPTAGYYAGNVCCISVADPELLKQITVKDFNSFMDHTTQLMVKFFPDPYDPRDQLFLSTGEAWRRRRQTLTPAFSASKMKMMVPLVKRSADTLVKLFGEKANSGDSIDILKMYGAFTMESLLAAAFGRVVDVQRGEADEVTKATNRLFEFAKGKLFLFCFLLLTTLPFTERALHYILGTFTDTFEPAKILHHTVMKLIEARRKGTERPKYKDILQLMIDASDDATEQGGAADEDGSSGCSMHQSTDSGPRHKLSNKEIVDISVGLMVAGYDTTSSTLSFTSYLLALHPDIQERLQSEIDAYYDNKPDATLYEASQEITYLDNVIQEALRMYPPVAIGTRTCTKTFTTSEMTIPKGAQVIIPIMTVHHDPNYWEDPEKFNPDRFTAEERAKRPTIVHMPFGFGPRNCIGMRFALLEAKIALIELLRRYSFVQTPDTEVPLKVVFGATMTAKNGIFLKVVRRV